MRNINQKGLFSEARFRVLRTLYYDSEGVSLRELSYRSGVSLRGVQVSTKSLLRLGLIKQKKTKGRLVFTIAKEHYEYVAVEALIRALDKTMSKTKAKEDSIANQNLLRAIDDLIGFSQKIKQSSCEIRKAF